MGETPNGVGGDAAGARRERADARPPHQRDMVEWEIWEGAAPPGSRRPPFGRRGASGRG